MLLKWLKTKPELQNKPELILDAIDEFAKTHRLINIGPSKGSLLVEEISKVEPEVLVELGTHTGYSSILMANELKKIGSPTSKIYTFEFNETFYKISSEIIKLAGLEDKIVQILGKASDRIQKIYEEEDTSIEKIDFLFIDHWKYYYLPDLRIIETIGLISLGTTIFADNVIKPGAPDYVEYVNSPPIFKNEYNTKNVNINAPHYPGKWGLLYDSKTVESVTGNGEKDGVEITKCVGILDA